MKALTWNRHATTGKMSWTSMTGTHITHWKGHASRRLQPFETQPSHPFHEPCPIPWNYQNIRNYQNALMMRFMMTIVLCTFRCVREKDKLLWYVLPGIDECYLPIELFACMFAWYSMFNSMLLIVCFSFIMNYLHRVRIRVLELDLLDDDLGQNASSRLNILWSRAIVRRSRS